MKHLFFVSLLLFSFIAKSQHLNKVLILGFSTSQIDGDNLVGYHKLGGVMGIATKIDVTKKLKLKPEVMYYGRGSRKQGSKIKGSSFLINNLNTILHKSFHYIDLNTILDYSIDSNFSIQGGLGYGHLFHLRSQTIDDIKNYQNDVFTTIGIGYNLNKNITLVSRILHSIPSIQKNSIFYHNSINFTTHITL